MIGCLSAGTGLLSWTVWNQGGTVDTGGTLVLLAAWFIWYTVQFFLLGSPKVKWLLRILSTGMLWSGLLWQSGFFVEGLSEFTFSVQADPIVEDTNGVLFGGVVFGLFLFALWFNYAQRKKWIQGLSFIRHSVLLLGTFLVVEFMNGQGVDVRQAWQKILLGWYFYALEILRQKAL
jgi:hypothetical protein